MRHTVGIPKWLLKFMMKKRLKDQYAWSVENAPLASSKGKLPLVIFSHGIGSQRCRYSAIVTELASYGYLVAAIAHHDESASCVWEEGVEKPFRDVKDYSELSLETRPIRIQEMSLTIDLLEALNAGHGPRNLWVSEADPVYYQACDVDFTGKLDLNCITAMGHSFGGATSLGVGGLDARVKQVIALDPWVLVLPPVIAPLPTLIITSGSGFQKPPDLARLKQISTSAPSSLVISIDGSGHFDHSDLPFFGPGIKRVKPVRFLMPKRKRAQLDFAESEDLENSMRLNRELVMAFLQGKLQPQWYEALVGSTVLYKK